MQNRLSSFINDNKGISEEFTSLPALAVVMIGFALFFAMIAGVYYQHNERVKSLDKYEMANFILEKLTSANGLLAEKGIIVGGTIDKKKFEGVGNSQDNIEAIIEESRIVGKEFGFKLVYWEEDGVQTIEWTNIPGDVDKVAASKQVAVRLNDAEIVLGVLTIIVWGAD
ncbi:MAG: hypothetical protein J7L58_04770 [Thermoplasmata archaeon]|nr:hypothetical protein [Thermoplasmata archaeon]